MPKAAAPGVAGNWKSTAFWALKILLTLMFLGTAGFKLSGAPAAVAEVNLVGLGQWFRYFTAACEISGALLLIWPRTTLYGAVVLAAVSIGAFVAQLQVLHQDVVHTLVLSAVFLAIAWAHRNQIAGPPLNSVAQS